MLKHLVIRIAATALALTFFYGTLHAQETGAVSSIESTPELAPFEMFVGAITSEKVNVRAGASLDREVLGQVNKPQKVFVVGEQGDWYDIRLPEGIVCYIHSDFVDADGTKGIVTGYDVNIRSGRGERFTILCKAQRGQVLHIVRQEVDWFAIYAPDDCLGHISRQYLTYYSTPEEYSEELLKNRERMARLESIKSEFELEAAKKGGGSFGDLIEKTEEFLKECSGTVEHPAAAQLLVLMRVKETETNLIKMQKELDKKMEEIRVLKEGPELPTPTASGRIDDVGMIFRRPGTHKLLVDGKMKYFLRSHELDLNKYKYAMVNVWGEIQEIEGKKHPLLIVEQVRYIKKKR